MSVPTSSPEYPVAENLLVRSKGVSRAVVATFGLPITTAVAFGSFTASAAASILEILFAGLFQTHAKGPIHKFIQERLVEFGGYAWDGYRKSISFEIDQLKEAACEICGQEDFARHLKIPVPEAIKTIKALEPEKVQEILDSTDGRLAVRDANLSFGLDPNTGQQRHHGILG